MVCSRYRQASLSDTPDKQMITPMVARLVREPFDREGWLFELKWDRVPRNFSNHYAVEGKYPRTPLNYVYGQVTDSLSFEIADLVTK